LSVLDGILPRMTTGPIYFDLTLAGGSIKKYTSADHPTYRISDAGVLTVTSNRGGTEVYSPSGWWRIDVRDTPPSVD
jgi:hypothetical protein